MMIKTEPSRELDKKIATALGWERILDFGNGTIMCWKENAFKVSPIELPKFTSSVDAAISLIPDGWRWEIMNYYIDIQYTRSICPETGKPDESWSQSAGPYCQLEKPSNEDDWTSWKIGHSAVATTSPIAICAAALQALDITFEEFKEAEWYD